MLSRRISGFPVSPLGLLVSAVLLTAVVPSVRGDESVRTTSLPVRQWLDGGERNEIPWKIRVAKPHLIFDQRDILSIKVELDPDVLQKASVHRDLHLVLASAEPAGPWSDTESITHYELLQPFNKKQDLEFEARLLARPGKHLIGIVLYDSVLKQRSIAKRWIEVPAIHNDPLPELNQNLPAVEFLTAPTRARDSEPTEAAPASSEAPSPVSMRRPRPPFVPNPIPAFAPPDTDPEDDSEPDHDERSIRISGAKPLEIDVLVDLTPSWLLAGRPSAYRGTAAVFRQTLHMMSLLHPEVGCVRLTGIDVIGQKVLFANEPGDNTDWNSITEKINALDPNRVDVQSLQSRKRMAEFFRAQVSHMLEDPGPPCAKDSGQPAQRVFVVAASGIVFPQGSQHVLVDPMPGERVKMYYLRATLARAAIWDEMEGIVKPLHPRLLSIDTPMDLRKAMATIVSDLRSERR